MQDLDSRSQNSQGLQQKSDQEDQTLIVGAEEPVQQESNSESPSQKKQEVNIPTQLIEKVHKQFQLIYIAAYSVYRQKLTQIAYKYGCDLLFVKNSYIVSCKDKSKYKQWEICKQTINKQISKIVYSKIEEKDKRFRMYNSPEINRVANERGINICPFNCQFYMHTNSMTEKDLIEEKKKLVKQTLIYPVCFTKKKILEQIDIEMGKFYKLVFEQYYKDRFTQNNIVVELSKNQRTIYVVGKPGAMPSQMMKGKNTVRNIIEGLTVVAFKNNLLNQKQELLLKQFLRKISPSFPITSGKLTENVTILLSKDNILRDLLKLKEKVITKVGIRQNTEIGIYIPNCASRTQKKQVIHKICKQMGYDYWGMWGIRYFRPMIASDKQRSNNSQVLELLIRITGGFNEIKDKYEVMQRKKQPQSKLDALKKKQLEQQSKYTYILKNSQKDSKQFQKVLRRDVMQDEVMMKKKCNILYSIMQGKPLGPYYIQKKVYDNGVDKGKIKLLQKDDLNKKGDYFEITFKIVGQFSDINKERLQKLLLQQLKTLRQQASDQLQDEKKGVNKKLVQSKKIGSRKITHMISKMIMVL